MERVYIYINTYRAAAHTHRRQRDRYDTHCRTSTVFFPTHSLLYLRIYPTPLSLSLYMHVYMYACVCGGAQTQGHIGRRYRLFGFSLSLPPIARMYASTSSSSAPLGGTLGYRAAYRRYIAETRLVSLPCELCGVAAEGTTCAHDRTKRLPIPTARPISSGLANSACLRANVCMGGREPFDERVALLRCEGAMLFWRDRDRARKGCLL